MTPGKEDWIYLAALLEGEGGLSVGKPRERCWQAFMMVGMEELQIVQWVADLWESTIGYDIHDVPRTVCPAGMLLSTIRGIFPYLKSDRKRMECLLIVAYRATVRSRGIGARKTPHETMFRDALYHASKAVKQGFKASRQRRMNA